MIIVDDKVINGIPVLELVDSKLEAEKLPLVFFFHGWNGSKERVLPQGYELAKRGFRVVLPEAKFHGARSVGKTETHLMEFWQIVNSSINEFGGILEHYQSGVGIKDNFVGISGLSMGGITTIGILDKFTEVKAAVCLMGCPEPGKFFDLMVTNINAKQPIPQEIIDSQAKMVADFDLSLEPEKIASRYIHFWHGIADSTVPHEFTKEFFDKVKNKSYAQNVTLTLSKGKGHKVDQETTIDMADRMFEFYQVNDK